jgi:hypothetical protein
MTNAYNPGSLFKQRSPYGDRINPLTGKKIEFHVGGFGSAPSPVVPEPQSYKRSAAPDGPSPNSVQRSNLDNTLAQTSSPLAFNASGSGSAPPTPCRLPCPRPGHYASSECRPVHRQ